MTQAVGCFPAGVAVHCAHCYSSLLTVVLGIFTVMVTFMIYILCSQYLCSFFFFHSTAPALSYLPFFLNASFFLLLSQVSSGEYPWTTKSQYTLLHYFLTPHFFHALFDPPILVFNLPSSHPPKAIYGNLPREVNTSPLDHSSLPSHWLYLFQPTY